MKYIMYWEYNPEDMENAVKKFKEYHKEREKNPEKYQEYLSPAYAFAGQTKGFALVEATPKQINNVAIYWAPLLHLKYKPIVQLSTFNEEIMKFI